MLCLSDILPGNTDGPGPLGMLLQGKLFMYEILSKCLLRVLGKSSKMPSLYMSDCQLCSRLFLGVADSYVAYTML